MSDSTLNHRGWGLALLALVHALAVIDAVALQAVGAWWLLTHMATPEGGTISKLVAALLIVWAVMRALPAMFDIHEYRWTVVKLAKWLWPVVLFAVVMKSIVAWQG